MRRPLVLLAIAVLCLAGSTGAGEEEKRRRIVYVPNDQIQELLARHERGVVLSVGEYLSLLRAARSGGLVREVLPGTDAVVLSGDLVGKVEGERVLLQAVYRVRVLAEGLVKVPFVITNVAVGEILLDGQPALVDHKAGLLIRGKGDHTVTMDLACKLSRREDVRWFSVALPAATSRSLDLVLPPEHEPLPGTLHGAWRAEGTRVRADLLPGARLVFSFRHRRPQGARAAYLTAKGRTLHGVESRLLTTASLVDVMVWRRGVTEMTFTVPEGDWVTHVDAPGLAGWDAGGTEVRLVFKKPVLGLVPVYLSLSRSLDGPGEHTLPEIRLKDAAADEGIVGVVFGSGVDGRILAAKGYVREAIPAPPAPRNRKAQKRRAAPVKPERVVLSGSAAAYRYWSADRSLVAATKAPEGRMDAGVNVVVRLTEAARDVTAILSFTARGDRRFGIESGLPAGYELVGAVLESPSPAKWEKTEDGRLRIEIPSGLAPDTTLRASLHLRHISDEWRGDGWESKNLPMPIPLPDVGGRIDGNLAVFSVPGFDVKDASLAGLAPEPVDRLGLPAAVLGYRWRGRTANGTLVVTREKPKVSVRHVAIVTPGEKVATYAGYLQYEIRRAGIRRFRFLVSGGLGDRLKVVAPDGTEPVRRTQEDGRDLWEITLPDKRQGEVTIRLTLEEEMALVDGARTFAFPEVTALDVEDEVAWLAVESGDNMEVGVPARETAEAAGLREISLEDMVLLDHKPQRGLLAAWQAPGHPWKLDFSVRRFEDMPVVAAFVRSARLTSVVARDGTVRTRAEYEILNADRQFLRVKLTPDATLWGAFVGGEAVKPSKGGDEHLVPLPTTGGDAAVTVVLLYEGRVDDLDGSGDFDLAAPALVGVVGAEAVWDIVLPDDFSITRTDGVFGAPPPAARDPWLYRMWRELSDFGAPMSASDSAPASGLIVQQVLPTNGQEVGGDFADALREELRPEIEEKKPIDQEEEVIEDPVIKDAKVSDHMEPDAPPAPSADSGADDDAMDMPPPPPTGKPQAPKRAGEEPRAPRERRGRVGSLSIDVPLVAAGSSRRVRALGTSGGVRVAYVDAPARERRAIVLLWLTVVAGLVLTRTVRIGKRAEGFRVHPLLFIVGLGAFATFAPAWFGARDPAWWDAIAQGCALTLLLAGTARFLRFATRAGNTHAGTLASRVAFVAVAIIVFLILSTTPGWAGEEAKAPASPVADDGETVYVPYDPAKLGELDGADRVFLPFSRFRELWNAAHPERKIETPDQAPVDWLLNSASYRGTIEKGTARIEAKFALFVLAEGWVEVAIPMAGTVVEKAAVDGEAVPVMAKGGAHVLVLRGKGAHRVELVLRTLVHAKGDARTVRIGLPPVPRSGIEFTLPIDDADVTLLGPVKPAVEGRVVRAYLGPWGGLSLTWSPKRETAKVEARVEVETREAVSFSEGRIDLRHRSGWRVVSGGVRELQWDLPEGYDLLWVHGGQHLKSWHVEGRRLTVVLTHELTGGGATMFLHLVRADGVRARKAALRGVKPIGVVRERGVLGIARAPDLRMLVSDTKNLDRIAVDPGTFKGLLNPGVIVDTAYRFLLRPLTATVVTEPVTADIRAEVRQLYLVERERLRALATFTFDVRGDGTFEFPVRIPAEFEVDQVNGKGLARWWRDGDRLVLSTASPVRGRFEVSVRYRRPLEREQTEIPLPEVHALDVTRETGYVVVAHAPGLSLILVNDDGLTRQNVAGFRKWQRIERTQKNVFAYRHEGGKYTLVTARSFPKPRVTPVTTTRLILEDGRVTVAVQFVFNIENAGQDTFRVFLPEGEGADFLLAAERKRGVTVEEVEHEGRKGRMLTLTLQQAAVGRYGFGLAYDKKLSSEDRRKGAVTVVALEPIGDNPASYVLIENQSAGQVGWTLPAGAGLTASDPTGFPYKPSGAFDWRQVLRGFRGKGRWSIGLDLTIHDFADFPDALISSAEMITAVGRDGWSRNRMVYRVLNRTRQYLEITMPAGARLESIRAGGRAVKPGRRRVAGESEDRVVVPLSRMRPGDISMEVEITWSSFLGGAGNGESLRELGNSAIREPVIHGLEVEKTFFTLSLPQGFDYSFDGNMNRINEANRKLEQLEEMNREAARLAQVGSKGSEVQQLRAYENFTRVREKQEKNIAWLNDSRNLKLLTPEEREKLRQELLALDANEQTIVSGSLARRANVGGGYRGPAGEFSGPDTNEALGKATTENLERSRELLSNTRRQSVQFKGKKNVLNQGFVDNYGPGRQAAPQTNEPVGGAANKQLQEAARQLGQRDFVSDAPFDGPSTNTAIGIGGGAGAPYSFAGGAGGGGSRTPNRGGAGGGAGGSIGFYDSHGRQPADAKAGLLSLPVTVPMTGRIYRFEKLNGGAELDVTASQPGTGREAAAFGMFALVAALLAVWFRFRPDRRWHGFWPLMLAIGVTVVLITDMAVGLFVLGVLVAAAWYFGGRWCRARLA